MTGRRSPRAARLQPLGKLLLVGALLAACAPPPKAARSHLLLVTVDTLRRDHVGAHGNPWIETTHLDRLAGEGVRFDRHYTVAGLTAPVHATLFTGLYPREHGLQRNGARRAQGLAWLPSLLRAAGWRTSGAIGAGVVGAEYGFADGFEEWDDDFDREGALAAEDELFERLGESVVDAALGSLQEDDGRPLFLWVHLFDPHSPYERPAEELPAAHALREAGAVFAEPSPWHDEAKIKRLRRRYAAEVRYTDRQLGRLLTAWEDFVGEEPNAVVFTADHGEALGEHGYLGHSLYLYEEILAVPLLVRRRDRLPAGARVSAVTSAVDLCATLLELVDLSSEGMGASLLRFLETGGESAASLAFGERPALPGVSPDSHQGELLAARRGRVGGGERGLIAVVGADWKYVWSEDAPDELYHLGEDPLEASLREDAAVRADLRQRVVAWQREHPAGARGPRGSLEAAPRTQRMLEALGYGGD